MSITKLVYKDLPFKVTASAKGYYDYENLFSLSKDSNISIEMKEYNEGNIEYSEPVESAGIVSVQANHLPNYKYLSKIKGCLMPYGREYKDLKTGTVSFENNGCAQEGAVFTGANNAYISTGKIFDFENFNSWEIQVCYTYNGGGSYPAIVATKSNGRDCDGINFCYEGGVLKVWLGNTEYSYWNVASFDTQLSLTEGTTYYIKFGFTGTEYYFQYNTDGSETYSDKVTYSSSNKIKTYNELIFLNNGYNLSNCYNNGSIDLSKTKIIVEGEVVWAYPKVTSKISSLPGTLLNYEDTGASVELDLYVISNLNKDENYFMLTKDNNVSIEGYKCQWVGKANIPSHDTFTYEEIDIVIEDFTNYKCEISNHIASGGFDSNTNTGKYIDTKEIMPLSEADSWEYQISVKNISAYNPSYGGHIISGSNSSDFKHPALYIPSDEVKVYLSSTGSYWDIVSEGQTGIKINPLNKYYFKYGFTGSKYYLDYATETNFTPVLTSNNTLGGDSPACTASHESQPAWWAFDGDLTTGERCWWTAHGECTEENPCWITFYYPVGIIPNGFFLKNEVSTPANPKSFKFEASNDNSTWTVLWETTEWPNETGYSETVDFGEQVKESYKYFRWYIYEGYESAGVSIQELAVRSEDIKSQTDFSNAFSVASTQKVYCDCKSRFLNTGYEYSSNKYILNGDLYLDELKLLINGETYWTPYKNGKKGVWTPSSNVPVEGDDNPSSPTEPAETKTIYVNGIDVPSGVTIKDELGTCYSIDSYYFYIFKIEKDTNYRLSYEYNGDYYYCYGEIIYNDVSNEDKIYITFAKTETTPPVEEDNPNEDNPYKDNEIIPQSILSDYSALSGKEIPILTDFQYDYIIGETTSAVINGVEYSPSYVLAASDRVADKGRSLYYVIYSLSEEQLVSILFNVSGELEITPPTETVQNKTVYLKFSDIPYTVYDYLGTLAYGSETNTFEATINSDTKVKTYYEDHDGNRYFFTTTLVYNKLFDGKELSFTSSAFVLEKNEVEGDDNPYKNNEIIPQSILSDYSALSGKEIPILTDFQYDYIIGETTSAVINGVEYSASYVLSASDRVADKGRSLYYVIYSLSEEQLVSILFNVSGELEITPPTETVQNKTVYLKFSGIPYTVYDYLGTLADGSETNTFEATINSDTKVKTYYADSDGNRYFFTTTLVYNKLFDGKELSFTSSAFVLEKNEVPPGTTVVEGYARISFKMDDSTQQVYPSTATKKKITSSTIDYNTYTFVVKDVGSSTRVSFYYTKDGNKYWMDELLSLSDSLLEPNEYGFDTSHFFLEAS